MRGVPDNWKYLSKPLLKSWLLENPKILSEVDSHDITSMGWSKEMGGRMGTLLNERGEISGK